MCRPTALARRLRFGVAAAVAAAPVVKFHDGPKATVADILPVHRPPGYCVTTNVKVGMFKLYLDHLGEDDCERFRRNVHKIMQHTVHRGSLFSASEGQHVTRKDCDNNSRARSDSNPGS